MHRVTARCCFLLVAVFCALSVSSAVAADDDAAKAKAEKAVIKPTKVIRQPPVQAVRVLDDNSVLVVHSHLTGGLDQLVNKKTAVDGKRSSAPGRFGWSKWELSSGRQLHGVTKELPFAAQGAIVSPDGPWVGVYGSVFDQQTETPTSASVAVWDTKSGRKISAWKVFGAFIFDVAVAPSGKRIALATQKIGSDKDNLEAAVASVQIWKVSKGKPERTLLEQKRCLFPGVAFDQSGSQLSAAFVVFRRPSATKTKRKQSSNDCVGVVWSTHDWRQTQQFDFPDGPLAGRALLHDSQLVNLASRLFGNGKMGLWDIRSGAKLKTFDFNHRPEPLVSALSPDGKRLAFLNQVGSGFTLSKRVKPPKVIDEIAVVDIQSGTVIARLREPKSRATAFSFTKDGRQIISGSSDGGIRIWKLPAAR